MGEINQLEESFWQYLREMDSYREMLMLTYWDMRTKIPKNAVEQRSEVVGFLAEKLHHLQTSDQMKRFIDKLKSSENDLIQKIITECEEIYDKNRKIPNEEYKAYVMLQSKSEAIWQKAREKADFSMFQPYLEELVEYNKRFANYWGYDKNIYDALLHNFEPGITTELLDDVFPKLRHAIIKLLDKINASDNKPNAAVLKGYFPKTKQKEFTIKVLKEIGYSFDSGRLDDTIHPFEITLNRNDVRITTRYDEEDFRMAVFGTIHEAGHALYEQNISPKLDRTPLATGTSMGIHESQSLFWENIISRSKPFWQYYYKQFKTYAPGNFQDVSMDEFYRAVNEVKPSFIRIEADELTYPLHIMIRYELEKALMNDEIKVADLPHLWNEKMVDYLGIEPPTDREGVLQDIHWSSGDFGYFPSYALGYMYATQFYHTMSKELDVEELVATGEFAPINEWLLRNIHQYGKTKKPLQLLEEITNEKLSSDYLVAYLTRKYVDIYQIP
ncbi:carboxypeptidase M32 [Oceanobacillus senegalensis]|uniref:carboxypeptidase M32 n=1 Tax=Oceanobacillus senegalensis TaxID=1936063 RepID=UPI000A311F64|nr:carboxypeptidase M32 [Oceanobacillus senegalensis]